MDTLNALLGGFGSALSPMNLLWALLGVTLGTFIGVLPGLGPALTIALLLPITFQVDPAAAFIVFGGIYFGSQFGGSTTSILINTPGESASIVTALEGNRMARNGRGAPALATAAIGSFVAGTIGVVCLSLLAPVVVKLALAFAPADYFALMVLSFVTVAAVLGNSVIRGLTSLSLGLLLGLVGVDLQSGQARFTFGALDLLDGIDVIIVVVGLFAVGETLHLATRYRSSPEEIIPVKGSMWMTAQDWARSWKAWIRGALIGFPIGAMPAGGAEIPTFLSYFVEKKLSKHPEEFGHGAIEGVAGPEAANNAAGAGVFVPLLTLGIPTSATAAVMLSAFQSYGINPGPQLLTSHADLVWTLIASLYIGNVMLLTLNLPLVGLWVQILRIPTPYLYGGILLFATVGTYGISRSVFDLVMLYAIGLAGFFMRRYDFPTSPVIIGMILGPLAEQQFRRAMTMSQGDLSVFVARPISASLLVLAFIALTAPIVLSFLRSRRERLPPEGP
ncbi:tripartite tricarboxylate transporter permease [Sinorhizobium medicae]|nr:tripartite tricarboxylate transporter permease [Sinorhizobium medicae]MDX1059083.1 tripartite tricarboxylate transporter permease [Sinorhizobium medicae]